MKKCIWFACIAAVLVFSCSKEMPEHSKKEKNAYKPEATALNDKAFELIKKSQLDDALLLYDQAIKTDETYYLPHLNKAEIYLDRNEYDAALYELEMAVQKKSNLAEALFLAGILYEKKGKIEKAAALYGECIRIYDDRINADTGNDSDKINRALTKKFLNDASYIDDLNAINNTGSFSDTIAMIKNLTKEELMEEFFP